MGFIKSAFTSTFYFSFCLPSPFFFLFFFTMVASVIIPTAGSKKAPRCVGYICWQCGREFGTASIGIHEPKCEKLWKAREAVKPAHQQRPHAPRPAELDSAKNRHERNRIARAYFEATQMEHCQLCPRTFAEGRLIKHMAVHKKELEAMKPGA